MNEVITITPVVTPAKFYTFRQNNSGGHFDRDENVSHYVIIEAHSAEEANNKAVSTGLYFDGCDTGQDCACCGDRWYPVGSWGDEGTDKPMIYDADPLTYNDTFCRKDETYCIVYFLDGSKKIYRKGDKA